MSVRLGRAYLIKWFSHGAGRSTAATPLPTGGVRYRATRPL
ncbi:hypothetical protein [Nocardia sp. NPDC046763]